ncbi:hypothetical protein DSUL_20231 [Desulfovibrionales bacterium]
MCILRLGFLLLNIPKKFKRDNNIACSFYLSLLESSCIEYLVICREKQYRPCPSMADHVNAN